MATVGDFISLALRDSGVTGTGQTPLAEDANDAFTRLNRMLSQWQRRRWLVFHLVDTAYPADGSLSYSVGAGGQFAIPRPDKINAAYARQTVPSQPNLIDYPLSLIESREEYSRISLKTMGSFPTYVFYDSGYPLGNLFVWPVPSSLYEIHILTKDVLGGFASLTSSLSLPPEYEEAVHYNLIQRLRSAYQLPADPFVNQQAAAALATIKTANAQIPTMHMPNGIPSVGGRYNIFSDGYGSGR